MAGGKQVVAGGLVATLLFLVFGGKAKAATPTPTPNPGPPKGPGGLDKKPDDPNSEANAEAAACEWAVANKPANYLGRFQVEGQTLAAWLAFVAYWKSHPYSNAQPTTVDEKAAFARLVQCVNSKLPAGPAPGPDELKPPAPKPNPPNPPPANPDPPISETPKPNSFYRIKAGDVLFALTAQAYGTKGGTQENFAAAKLVNNADYNQRFVRGGIEPNLWGAKGRITFMPSFGTFAEQRADSVKGSEGAGKQYAVIFFPPLGVKPKS